MKVSVIRSKVLEGLKLVQNASNAKSKEGIYANVKIDAADGKIALTATNGEITIYSEVDADVAEAGETTMPAQMLCKMIELLPEGDVKIEESDDRMKIKSGNSKYSITGLSSSMFPKINNNNIVARHKIKAASLRDMIRKVSYAQAEQDSARRTMMSVLFELFDGKMRCVATDGKRLAIAESEGVETTEGASRYIVPSTSISAIQKFLLSDGDVEMVAVKGQICLEMNNGKQKFYTRLIDGEYPDYSRVIPKNHNVEAIVDRNDFVNSVQRVSVTTSIQWSSIKTTFENNTLVIEAKGDNACDAIDQIPVKCTGDKVESIFSPKYILDAMKSIDSDEIHIEMTNGFTPAVFKSEQEKFFYLLMPLRVSTP